MNCYNGHIGLLGCSQGTPASGLFINQLPGLPVELFASIANSDQATKTNLWRDVQATAQAQLLSDAGREFSKRYKIRPLLRKMDVGKNIDTTSITAASPVYRGFQVNADYGIASGYTRSHLMGIPVEYMELYVTAPFAGTVLVKILDADTKSELFSATINNTGEELIAGWNNIPVNMVFDAKNLAFVYASTLIGSVELTLPPFANDSLCGCLADWYGYQTKDDCPGKIFGISTTGLNINTITTGTNTFGLTAKIGFNCSYENFLCENKTVFTRALWYLLGHHTCWHALNSPSFTRANTVDRKITEQLMSDYLAMYESELTVVCSGINLDDRDLCLECDSIFQKKFVNPYN